MTANGETPIVCRGIRGATTAAANTAEDILEATQELVTALIALNDLDTDDIVSAIFTTTPDLTAMFPALAARTFGWTEVPMMCSHEMAVPGSLEKAVRVLVHINTTKSGKEIRHVYLKGAKQLRPEWGIDDAELARITGAPSADTEDVTNVPVTTSAGISS
ncbi:MAG TPA: chorismate mutase [Thermomicrobiales bacterium]|nr:chorismate mutase [Thermomicrobiales bacterium]